MDHCLDAANLCPGALIFDRYLLQERLGEGGVGIVMAAQDQVLRRRVALKCLRYPRPDARSTALRFLREARAMAQLESPHTVRIFDALPGVLVMEYLRGSDLARFLRHRGRVPPRQAALLLLQACDALAEAHALGIVHRDIKLENLFLTCRPGHESRGYLKVLDFGLSKVFMEPESAQEEVTVTDTQCVLGSPEFMSPEQTRCSRDVDARTDVWALGAVLYALLSGRRPFARRFVADVRYAVLAGEYLPLNSLCDDLPVGLDSIVERCLQLDRDARYESVKELAAALEPFAKTPRRTASTPPPQSEPVPGEMSRSDTSSQRPRRLDLGPLSFLRAPGNPKVSL